MYQQLVNEYKATRKRKNISQKVAGALGGLSPMTISRMESGESIPRLDIFIKMAKGIGMMVVIAPLPAELVVHPPKIEEKIEEVKEVNYDDWDYEEEKS